jgi:hypothetical protein
MNSYKRYHEDTQRLPEVNEIPLVVAVMGTAVGAGSPDRCADRQALPSLPAGDLTRNVIRSGICRWATASGVWSGTLPPWLVFVSDRR